MARESFSTIDVWDDATGRWVEVGEDFGTPETARVRVSELQHIYQSGGRYRVRTETTEVIERVES